MGMAHSLYERCRGLVMAYWFRVVFVASLLLITSSVQAAVVFMYHRFGESAYPSTNVGLPEFEAHLDHLDEAGYDVWPLARIAAHLVEGREIPDRVVGISIDDAYASVYHEAWPRLQARGMHFTVFAATDPVDQGQRAYMSWDQMREMAAAGVHFANHSTYHDKLHQRREGESQAQWERRIREDIAHSEQRLIDELGDAAVPAAPRLHAYPYGEFSVPLMELLEDMEYVAFGQHSGAIGPSSDLRALPRFPMAEAYADIAEFRQKAATFALPLTQVEPRESRVGDQNPPRLVATLGQVSGSPNGLNCFASRQGALEIEWVDREQGRFAVQASEPYSTGRARYNCTLMSAERGRFYWYSKPWIVE